MIETVTNLKREVIQTIGRFYLIYLNKKKNKYTFFFSRNKFAPS